MTSKASSLASQQCLVRMHSFRFLTVMSHIRASASGFDKFQQVGVELFLARIAQTMRSAGIYL